MVIGTVDVQFMCCSFIRLDVNTALSGMVVMGLYCLKIGVYKDAVMVDVYVIC